MVSQRQSQGSLQRQGVPIRGQLEGPRVQEPRASYTSRTSAPPRPRSNRPRNSRPKSTKRNVNVADYSPTRAAEKGSGIGLLEAEFFGILFILIIGLLFGSDTYGNKIMSFMKRGTLTAILFFFLALIAGIGPNAAKVSKGIGGLVFVAILVSTPGQAFLASLDNFFKQAWVGTTETAGEGQSSADAGTQGATTGVIGNIENAVTSGANRTTELQLPGIGPAFVIGIPLVNAIKKLFHL